MRTKLILTVAGLLALSLLAALPVLAQDASGDAVVPERILGKPDAPVTVQEFVSLTCPHCAEFYTKTLPELEKKYVDTGKVKFILRDFPLDGAGLKAAALARCMPEDEYYPFIAVLYSNQPSWVMAPNADKIITQYAKLGGLAEDKATACLADTKMQDAIIAGRTVAQQKYNVQSTPTFIINDGVERVDGALSVAKFSAVFDKVLTSLPPSAPKAEQSAPGTGSGTQPPAKQMNFVPASSVQK